MNIIRVSKSRKMRCMDRLFANDRRYARKILFLSESGNVINWLVRIGKIRG
jgi:hypothetical protein